MLGDRHEAEDVSQEVFLRVFRSLKRWDSARPLRPWIIGIAVNRCRTPKCRASQVTDSPSPISPLVRPATARSPVSASDRVWKSMSRARSKQTSIGAAITVTIRNAAMPPPTPLRPNALFGVSVIVSASLASATLSRISAHVPALN
jgi:hypothetical protein